VNGTLLSRDGRSILRFERTLKHPPERVWRAITESEALAGWFPGRIEGEWTVVCTLRFIEAEHETHGEVTQVDPPRRLSYTWNDSVLSFELRPDPAGCLLIFMQIFDDRPFAASYATGWQACLDALDDGLLGRPAAAPLADEGGVTSAYQARHEAYAQIFGLLAGSVEADVVRFERLLPYPAGEVWDALVDDREPVLGAVAPAAATSAAAPDGAVTEMDHEKSLSYEATTGQVDWRLTDGPGGTLVTLTHRVLPPKRLDSLVAWHSRLEALANRLASGRGTTSENSLRRHYERDFSIDTSQ
jgi:uncharacterized protein YndB with AHSA1/START domain